MAQQTNRDCHERFHFLPQSMAGSLFAQSGNDMNKYRPGLTLVFLLLLAANQVLAGDADSEISQMLDYFADEWNAGELASIEGQFHKDFVLVTEEGVQSRDERISELRMVISPGNDHGTLSFESVMVEPLGKDHVVAYGRTRLVFKDGTELGGMFSTVYVNTPFGWKALLTHE